MMIKYLNIVGLFLLVSCGSDVEVETVALEDILPQSTYSKDTLSEESIIEVDSISQFRNDLENVFEGSTRIFSESGYKLKLFPDRLTNVSREQELIILDKDTISMTVWEFSDSLTTINAFYNWLDCFGDKCAELKIGDEVNFSKKSVLALVSNHHLIYLESPTGFDMNKWQKELIPAIFPQDFWIYAISQPARRKARWQIFEQ